MSLLALAILTLLMAVTDGYSREKFPHWDKTGSNCNVRDTILERDGTFIVKQGCNVVGGKWYSSYDSRTLEDPLDVDIDHIVPLAEAWRSGANTWTQEQRQKFANDPINLRAVSDTSNQAKGDQGIDKWLPNEQVCDYVILYFLVKEFYTLEITNEEKLSAGEICAE